VSLFVSSVVLFSGEASLISVGFGPSKQLLGYDFSFRYDGGECGRGKSEKDEEEERGVEAGYHPYEHGRRGLHALRIPVCQVHQDETKQLCGKGPK
jgi:hypothetical protein